MSNILYPAAAVAILAAFLAYRRMQGQDQAAPVDTWVEPVVPGDETAWGAPVDMSLAELDSTPAEDSNTQLPTMMENIYSAVMPDTYWPTSTSAPMENQNIRAFLDTISYAEGTSGPDGYRAMFGYPAADRWIDSFADHPRRKFTFKNSKGQTLTTSAAGKYQFLMGTWDELRKKLGLQDFSPASQDAAAIELIRQRGALNDVRAGRIASAIAKCRSTWASLPGAGYSQPERSLPSLLAAYTNAGGAILEV